MTEQTVAREEQTPQEPAAVPKKRASQPVLGYIALLFVAAFALILFSYCMHDRSNQAAIDELQSSVQSLQSVSAMQESLAELENDKLALENQVQALEDKLTALEEEATAAQAQAQTEAATLALAQTRRDQALDWLTELTALRAAGKYPPARKLLAEFEATGLAASLPREPLRTGEDVLSPAQRYAELVEALA